MIPLRDENPSATIPVVTRTLIVANVALFVYQILLGPGVREFVFSWGMVPERITMALVHHEEPLPAAVLPALTSMFLHGGWMHLLGNMWYLMIFGDNVEDRLGHFGFFLYYVAGGVFAALVHYLTNTGSGVPTVGASGAIAAVLGGYAVAYPHARIHTLIPLFPFFVQVVALPALIVLGLWFVFQFFSGAMSIGGRGGGIAFWAHVGGFVFGFVTMRAFGRRRSVPESRAWVEP